MTITDATFELTKCGAVENGFAVVEGKKVSVMRIWEYCECLCDYYVDTVIVNDMCEAPKAEEKKAEKEANKKVEKSLMVINIKPYDEETDLKALFKKIQATQVKGCKWSETCNICPLAYGICYLEISCVIEDDVCSEDDVIEAITQFEDEVQSTEVASFNKFS